MLDFSTLQINVSNCFFNYIYFHNTVAVHVTQAFSGNTWTSMIRQRQPAKIVYSPDQDDMLSSYSYFAPLCNFINLLRSWDINSVDRDYRVFLHGFAGQWDDRTILRKIWLGYLSTNLKLKSSHWSTNPGKKHLFS